MRGIMTETISRIMFARKAREAEPEVATAGEAPAPEGA
jgi:hypothetical protein